MFGGAGWDGCEERGGHTQLFAPHAPLGSMSSVSSPESGSGSGSGSSGSGSGSSGSGSGPDTPALSLSPSPRSVFDEGSQFHTAPLEFRTFSPHSATSTTLHTQPHTQSPPLTRLSTRTPPPTQPRTPTPTHTPAQPPPPLTLPLPTRKLSHRLFGSQGARLGLDLALSGGFEAECGGGSEGGVVGSEGGVVGAEGGDVGLWVGVGVKACVVERRVGGVEDDEEAAAAASPVRTADAVPRPAYLSSPPVPLLRSLSAPAPSRVSTASFALAPLRTSPSPSMSMSSSRVSPPPSLSTSVSPPVSVSVSPVTFSYQHALMDTNPDVGAEEFRVGV
ncbi:hypothetical protein K439DRAFT_1642939 [Ramaria rubella]|nr:hypothetical protein K439DRAFT_1642939 [Ramaria rubella]